ncbi:alpha/beta-hydrolase [Atractiella rhizophila]|nr:alpha/beta-hydrolase [Atractiella rhizophila]
MKFVLAYKHVKSTPLLMDVHPSDVYVEGGNPLAFYFHSGGLTGGRRDGFFPQWLADFANQRGVHVASADYRLIPSCTVADIIEDVKDIYEFVRSEDGLQRELEKRGLGRVDKNKLLVTGGSAGVYCALQLTLHLLSSASKHPPPLGFLNLYGELDIGARQHNHPPFSLPEEYRYLWDNNRAPVTGTDVKWFYTPVEECSNAVEREEADQTTLTSKLFAAGILADAFTSSDSLSRALAEQKDDSLETQAATIPSELHCFFPLLQIPSSFPPTLIFHGEQDAAIQISESERFAEKLKQVGVPEEKIKFVRIQGEGSGHGFDRGDGFEKYWESVMKEKMEWLFEFVN